MRTVKKPLEEEEEEVEGRKFSIVVRAKKETKISLGLCIHTLHRSVDHPSYCERGVWNAPNLQELGLETLSQAVFLLFPKNKSFLIIHYYSNIFHVWSTLKIYGSKVILFSIRK
jgi:hypothetical protein